MFWRREKKEKKNDEIELVVLKTINNNIEFDIIKGLLEDNNIPYIIRDYGAGGYMRIAYGDSSIFKTDILVEKSAYEKAKEILDQLTFD